MNYIGILLRYRREGCFFITMSLALTAGASCASLESAKSADDMTILKEQVWSLQKQTAELGLKVSNISNDVAILSERMKSFEEDKKSIENKAPDKQPGSRKTGVESESLPASQKEPPKPEVAKPQTVISKGSKGAKTVVLNPDASEENPRIALASNEAPAPPVDRGFKGLGQSEMYRRSMELFNSGEYSKAAASFSFFVRRYPSSHLASRAQYWLGETFYSRKNYSRAAIEFKRALVLYSNSLKTPDAMLKLAFCKIRLNQFPEGKAVLKEVIDKYPSSIAASTARRKLEKVDKNEVESKSGDS